jgi:hypothetical protein
MTATILILTALIELGLWAAHGGQLWARVELPSAILPGGRVC